MRATLKYAITTLTVLSISITTQPKAFAQRVPMACQEEAKTGLSWEGNAWRYSKFKESKFILVLDDNNLTIESVSKALRATNLPVTCKSVYDNRIACFDIAGGFLLFNKKNMQGAISQLFGSTINSLSRRDTVSVFNCQKF